MAPVTARGVRSRSGVVGARLALALPALEQLGPLLDLALRERHRLLRLALGVLGAAGFLRWRERRREEQVRDRDVGAHRARVTRDLEVGGHDGDRLLPADAFLDDPPDQVVRLLGRPRELDSSE